MNWMRWLFAFIFLPIILSIITGDVGIAYISLLPASALAFAILFEPPSGFRGEREVEKTLLHTGDETEVRVKLSVEKGSGSVVVGDVLPPSFELVEGKNRHVFFKRPGEQLEVEYRYRVRALKRGVYFIPPLEVEGKHLLGIESSKYAVVSDSVEVRVSPRAIEIRKSILVRRRGRPGLPPAVKTAIGFTSTEFKEIREYRPGDSIRSVNWKASARFSKLLVNEYEREGYLTVMFYLDGSDFMAVGGYRSGAFETAIEFLVPMIDYLLKQGYQVGLYVLGHGHWIPPMSGSSASSTFRKLLIPLGMTSHNESLPLAVEKTQYLLSGGVVPIVITNVNPGNVSQLSLGVKNLSKLTRVRPIVVDIDVYPAAGSAGTLISLRKKKLAESIPARVIRISRADKRTVFKLMGVLQ